MRLLSTLLLLLGLFHISSAQPCLPNTNSLTFGASSVNFTTDVNLAPANAITVEAWIRATSWAINYFDGTILCKHSWSQGEQGYVFRAGNNGQLDFTVCGKDSLGNSISWIRAFSPSGAMALNTWNHVAGTYDGDSVRVFINGIQRGATSLPHGMIQGLAYPIRIGALSDQAQGMGRFWAGQIDEVRIWDRALDTAEINAKRFYHLDPTQETGLVGNWRFNAGSGTSVVDQTANTNNGTTNGTTWSPLVPFNQTTTAPIIFPNGNTMTSSITAATYQWNLNGSPIAGATGQSWTALSNGSYTITITDSLGCMATSSPYIITGVGLNELSAENILVKNNSTQLIISLRSGEKIKNVSIYNAAMQRIGIIDFVSQEVTWDKGNLAKGIYTVIILSENNQSGVYRFVQVD